MAVATPYLYGFLPIFSSTCVLLFCVVFFRSRPHLLDSFCFIPTMFRTTLPTLSICPRNISFYLPSRTCFPPQRTTPRIPSGLFPCTVFASPLVSSSGVPVLTVPRDAWYFYGIHTLLDSFSVFLSFLSVRSYGFAGVSSALSTRLDISFATDYVAVAIAHFSAGWNYPRE